MRRTGISVPVALVTHLIHHAEADRKSIMAATGLTRSSVYRGLGLLVDARLIQSTFRPSPERGRGCYWYSWRAGRPARPAVDSDNDAQDNSGDNE